MLVFFFSVHIHSIHIHRHTQIHSNNNWRCRLLQQFEFNTWPSAAYTKAKTTAMRGRRRYGKWAIVRVVERGVRKVAAVVLIHCTFKCVNWVLPIFFVLFSSSHFSAHFFCLFYICSVSFLFLLHGFSYIYTKSKWNVQRLRWIFISYFFLYGCANWNVSQVFIFLLLFSRFGDILQCLALTLCVLWPPLKCQMTSRHPRTHIQEYIYTYI